MTESEQPPAGGVPASGAGPLYDLLAADPPTVYRSVASEIIEQRLAAPRVPHRTKVEQWVEDPSRFEGGYWQEVVD